MTWVSRNSGDAGEVDDLVELAVDLGLFHAEDRAVEVDVFAAGQFGVEAGADFEEGADAAAHPDFAFGRLGDAAEDLEERGFARAVGSDDADDGSGLNFEGDVAEGPEDIVGFPVSGRQAAQLAEAADR